MSDTLQTTAPLSDRRALRSRRALWEALLALLQDHDWAEVNVQMICEKADVARSTFYAHFATKQDLLDSGFALGAEEIEKLAQQMPASAGDLPVLVWLVDHLASSQGFRRRLQGSSAGHAIMTRFKAMTSDLLRRDLERQGRPVVEETLTFLVGGIFARIEAWLAQGCRQPQPDLVASLRKQVGVHV
jgi:AcrR family transcriptional regulator